MIEYTSIYNVRNTMYQQFENSVKSRGENPCLYYYNNTLSWNQTAELVDKCAAALIANGVKKGDRVIICLPNMPQCVVAVYAVNKIGAIVSMLHPLSVKSEADYAVNLVGAKFAFCFDVSEKAFKDDPDLTVVKCRTAQYFPKTPYGVIANALYKKKIKGKTAPADNVKKLIDWSDFLKEGAEYIAENGVPETVSDSQATAAVMMTGGTTGNPKGVMLSSEAINNLSYQLVDVVTNVLNMEIDQDNDGMLTALPVFHGFGFALCMHVSMCVGMAQALFPAFDAKMCSSAIKKYNLNYIFGVPDFFEKVYKAGYLKGVDMSAMKLIGSGGDVVPYSLTEKMDRLLKENGAKCHFVSGYGLTECVTVCTFTDPRREAPQGCIGVTCYNIEAMTVKPGTTEKCVGEDGELCIYGPTLMQGYWNDPQETAKVLVKHEDGKIWLHTGDMCRIEENGDIYYRQRLKRVYKISGYLVYPSFIEETYRSMVEIYDCCVIGKEDGGKTMLKLFVVKNKRYRNDDEAALVEKIRTFGNQNLSKWSVPREIVFIDELPRTKVGKVDFKVLN
ncbi:MAG: acyl--CoA ligase [Clostridiales bacterium]|nr:acyl--CoA ligase [Clostridiales bacterium]